MYISARSARQLLSLSMLATHVHYSFISYAKGISVHKWRYIFWLNCSF